MDINAIPGIHVRHKLCKICQAFDNVMLADITLDILLQRKTWAEIRSFYSPLLPQGLTPITDINIKNHKKHSNPNKIAHEALRAQGKPTNELEHIETIYSELVGKEMKSQDILRKTFFDRISNAKILQEYVTALRKEYNTIPADADPVNMLKRGQLLNKLSPRIRELDDIYSSLQQIALKDVDLQKDRSGESALLIQAVVMLFQNQLRSFGQEMVNYLLVQEFASDPERGKQVLARLSGIMDLFLAPALDHKQLLKTITKKQIDNASYTEEK